MRARLGVRVRGLLSEEELGSDTDTDSIMAGGEVDKKKEIM